MIKTIRYGHVSRGIIALMFGAFGIGMTEFIVAGLLPNISKAFHISITTAGLLVSAYATGVAIGAPLITALSGKYNRKHLLIALMLVFVVGNVLAAVAFNYQLLLAARIIASLTHGTFFGVGAVVATRLVPKDKGAAAIAMMFTGLTAANVAGVPLGTFIGQHFGWRVPFWIVVAVGTITLILLYKLLPTMPVRETPQLRSEFKALKQLPVLLGLGMTLFGYGGLFAVFTYIAPILTTYAGLDGNGVSSMLVIFGTGLVFGNIIGGKWADRHLLRTLLISFVSLTIMLCISMAVIHTFITAAIMVFLLGFTGFLMVPGVQLLIVKEAVHASHIASAFNISAFNVGITLGSLVGGAVIESRFGLSGVGVAGALITAVAVLFTGWLWRIQAAQNDYGKS
jgi:DHA1 family inner membrane transport protein